jgi:predicted nucleic acid-binding protein
MKSTYFFDTSAVVKFYRKEAGTEWVESIFSDGESTIVLSELTTVEFHSAVAKKIRTKEIMEDAGRQALMNFQKDRAERFLIVPLDSKMIRKTKELIDRYGGRFHLGPWTPCSWLLVNWRRPGMSVLCVRIQTS